MAKAYAKLGRRERQIMDVLFRRGRATSAEVLHELTDPPGYSAVRGMLRHLERKGYVRHDWDGPRHVYLPTGSPRQIRRSAARHMLQTFFNNSMTSAVAAMLGAMDGPVSDDDLKRLGQLVADARKKGGRP